MEKFIIKCKHCSSEAIKKYAKLTYNEGLVRELMISIRIICVDCGEEEILR